MYSTLTKPVLQVSDSSDSELLSTWRQCQERELGILSTPPPRNALEEMILQTKQGKLWHFPVNNEQGIKVIFYSCPQEAPTS